MKIKRIHVSIFQKNENGNFSNSFSSLKKKQKMKIEVLSRIQFSLIFFFGSHAIGDLGMKMRRSHDTCIRCKRG